MQESKTEQRRLATRALLACSSLRDARIYSARCNSEREPARLPGDLSDLTVRRSLRAWERWLEDNGRTSEEAAEDVLETATAAGWPLVEIAVSPVSAIHDALSIWQSQPVESDYDGYEGETGSW